MTDRDDQQNPQPTPPAPTPDAQPGGYTQPEQPGYPQAGPTDQAGSGQQPYGQQASGQQPYDQQGGGYAQPNPYAQAGYGTPGPKKTLSLIGMIAGIVGVLGSGVVFFPIVGSILGLFIPAGAVVLGFLGRSREGTPAKGFWMTALITGFVGIGIALIALIGWILVITLGDSGAFDTYDY